MIWLTIIVCLANGTACTEKQDFQPFTMPMSCAVAAQQAAAEWIRTHPTHVLREARCEPESRKQRRT